MIRIQNARYDFSDYRDFNFAVGSFGKAGRLGALAFCVAAAIFFCATRLDFFEGYSQIKMLADILLAIAAGVALTALFYCRAIRSTFDSSRPFRLPSTLELLDDEIRSENEKEKIALPKKFIKKIVFADTAIYIVYFYYGFLILKKYFESEEEWKEAARFIKERYVSENVLVKNEARSDLWK